MPDSTEQPIEDTLKAQLKDIDGSARTLKDLSEAGKAVLRALGKGKNIALSCPTEVVRLRKLLERLRDSELEAGTTTALEELARLEDEARERAESEAMRLLADLDTAARARSLVLRGRYPEVTIGPLTLRFDLTAKGMRIRLDWGPGIETLETLSGAEPSAVLEAVSKVLGEMEEASLPDEEFLRLVRQARDLAALRRGGEPTPGPQPIRNVLAMTALLRQPDRFLRNPVRAAFKTYGQAMFAYQLSRLETRRVDDVELALGIAAREDVKDGRSLWIPRRLSGEGTHYATLDLRKRP